MTGTTKSRLARGLAVVAATGLLVAACTADVGQGGAPPRESAAPTAAPTRTPAPTPTPIDVAKVFAREFADLETVEAEISGTVVAGGITTETSGTLRVCEDGTYSLMTLSANDEVVSETETITANGTSYWREQGGMWFVVQPTQSAEAAPPAEGTTATARTTAFESALAAGTFEVVGTENSGGTKLYRLASTEAIEVGPADVGLSDPTVDDFSGELVFLATADGSPVGFSMSAEWEQGPADARTGFEFDLRYDYTRINKACDVKPPLDAWTVYTSAELGYRMAHPVRWDVVHEPEGEDFAASDAYIGPIDGEVDVILWNDLQGNTPNTWFRDSQAWLADEFGTEPTVTTELLTLADGASVRVFELHYTYEGDDYFFQQAVVFAGDRAWDVNWYSTPGTEDAARAMLLSFVGTFEPIAD